MPGLDGGGRRRARAALRVTARLVANALMLLTGAAMLVLAVGPHVLGYRTVVMRSGSMSPAIDVGDIVVIRSQPVSELHRGQLLTFAAPVAGSPVYTHRVASVRRVGTDTVVRTKGDANTTVDPWRAQITGATAWRPVLVVPYVGSVVAALHRPWVHALTVWLIPLSLCVEVLLRLWRRPRGVRAPIATEAEA